MNLVHMHVLAIQRKSKLSESLIFLKILIKHEKTHVEPLVEVLSSQLICPVLIAWSHLIIELFQLFKNNYQRVVLSFESLTDLYL